MTANQNKPVTAEAIAQHFGVAVSTVQRWVREDRIPYLRPSRRIIRFHIDEVEKALGGGMVQHGQ